MINRNVFTKDYINGLVRKYRADPQIIERAVFALGLLEALVLSGADFIFKGGSALMVLLEKPLRLSTDIDIIVEPDYDIENYVRKASRIYPFISFTEDTRVGANRIVKKHFRLFYKSLVDENIEVPILLDVLFEENHYTTLNRKEIKTEFLETQGTSIYAKMPSADSILGDKLTAFAPHTIGVIPLSTQENGKIINKRIETIKQFLDVSSLFDASHDFQEVSKTYKQTALSELAYRGLTLSFEDCLMDSFNSALSILSRGKWMPEDYPDYLLGIRGLNGYLINTHFTAETAYRHASKVMYLSACLISGIPPESVIPEAVPFSDQYSIINNIRRIDKSAFNLVARAIMILKNNW